jgi:NADH-quinone oxidoreductase subunit E
MNDVDLKELKPERKLRDPAVRARLLATLYTAQERQGYLSQETLGEIAEQLGLSESDVLSTASFYTLFRTEPTGRYLIQVCEGLSCYLHEGAETVQEYISTKLGIGLGETTEDGRFTLIAVQCLGACDTAPNMMVNQDLYDNLTPDAIDRILDRLGREG